MQDAPSEGGLKAITATLCSLYGLSRAERHVSTMYQGKLACYYGCVQWVYGGVAMGLWECCYGSMGVLLWVYGGIGYGSLSFCPSTKGGYFTQPGHIRLLRTSVLHYIHLVKCCLVL